jgi:AcrR family transcriptional regulator
MSAFDNSPHVLRPRQRRSREALAKIVQAAEHILRTDGPDGFSIAAVAHASGLPIANIYRRFRVKEDILLVLKDDVTARVDRAALEKVGNHFAGVEDFISDFVLAIVNAFKQDAAIHRALLDSRVRTPAMTRIGSAARRRIYVHYRDKMREFLPSLDDKRAETVITVSFNIVMYAVVGRATAIDPLLKSFTWNEIAEEYTSAAVGYLKNEILATNETLSSLKPPLKSAGRGSPQHRSKLSMDRKAKQANS